MTSTHGQDEQPRDRWPVNKSPGLAADDPRIVSGPGGPESGETRVLEKSAVEANPADGLPGGVDFATYVNQELSRRGFGRPDGGETADSGGATAVGERVRPDELERVGDGRVYRSGEVPLGEAPAGVTNTVLGLDYTMLAPRSPIVPDEQWASSLRSFARAAVWALPVAALLLALSAVFGWPTETTEPILVSPGTWVVVTALGLGLWLVGVVGLAALSAYTRVRPWGYVAVVASALGVALLAPVVGAVGLARPAITRVVVAADDARIAEAGADIHARLLDHAVGRWLLVGGGVLLAVGAFAVAGAILGSRVLQRHDGWLVLLGLGIAILGAYLSWEFLLVLAAMVILAGALGLAYTVSRLTPDGGPPPAY
jgi:hypothetical protein